MNRKQRRAEQFGHRSMVYADRIRETRHLYCQFSIQDGIDAARREEIEAIRALRLNSYFLEDADLSEPRFDWRFEAWDKAAPEDGFRYGLNSWEYVMINTNRQKSPDPDPVVLFVSYNDGATYKRVYSTNHLKDEQLLADVTDCKKNFLPYYINCDGEYYEGREGYIA